MQNATNINPEGVARDESAEAPSEPVSDVPAGQERPREIGGPPGPEPTRFGDWEKKGRCIDF